MKPVVQRIDWNFNINDKNAGKNNGLIEPDNGLIELLLTYHVKMIHTQPLFVRKIDFGAFNAYYTRTTRAKLAVKN